MTRNKVAFLTLGCKVNAYETDAMEQLFKKAGYTIVKFNEIADIYVVNTCSVTHMADRKSRQMLHKAKKNNKEAIVVAVGCYVQGASKEASEDKAIDLIIGNNKKKDIVDIVEEYMNAHIETIRVHKAILDINDTSGSIVYEDLDINETEEKTRAYIKIQDGCNQFCSYCIIPYVRGRIRSRRLDNILKEVHDLANNGYKEVVVTGIHVSSYGLDFEDRKGAATNEFEYKYLLEVIEEIAKIAGIERIRLGSLEPRIITEEFIVKLSKIEKLCPHFHLSLQSGCDETLKRMNRKYTTSQFLKGCDILRKYFDNPAITTDIIVGFPGETDEEFDKTYEFLNKVKFAQMHVFKYSVRKGTVAEKLPNQITDTKKNIRSKKLLDMSIKNNLEYMNKFLDCVQKVLIEEKVCIDDESYYIGHNERYMRIAIKSEEVLEQCNKEVVENNILDVNIIGRLTNDILEGNLK